MDTLINLGAIALQVPVVAMQLLARLAAAAAAVHAGAEQHARVFLHGRAAGVAQRGDIGELRAPQPLAADQVAQRGPGEAGQHGHQRDHHDLLDQADPGLAASLRSIHDTIPCRCFRPC